MDPQILKAWADAVVPWLAFGTAIGAILTYHRGKRVEVAKLQKQIFDDLYLSGKFDRIRLTLDFDYEARVVPALTRSLAGKLSSPEERSLLLELDNFLNLFEYVLYLEQDKKLLTSKDRQALLAYWIEWMGGAERAALRDYLERFDYEKLTTCLNTAIKTRST